MLIPLDIASAFNAIRTDLLLPPALAVITVALTWAGFTFLKGGPHALGKIIEVLVAMFIIAFAGVLATALWAIFTAAAK